MKKIAIGAKLLHLLCIFYHVQFNIFTSLIIIFLPFQLAAMGGSKGGKYSKNKGKSKLTKNDTSHKTHETLNSKHDLAQTSNDKSGGLGDSKEKSHDPQIQASYRYTESELEDFLFIKLEDLYSRAKGWLLKSGYDVSDVERAMLNNGYVHGPKDFLNNILANTVANIKQKMVPNGTPFDDMDDLYKAMLEDMVDSLLHAKRDLKRSEALWLLLFQKWGSVPPITMPSGMLYEDENTGSIKDGSSGSTSHSSNEGTSAPNMYSAREKTQSSISKKVGVLERIHNSPALASKIRQDMPILREYVLREIGTSFVEQQYFQDAACALQEGSNLVDPEILAFLDEECVKRWQESSSDDLRTALIVDLINSIRDLEEEVKVRKEWAEKKVVDSAKRLSKDLLELNMLRLKKMETQCLKDEKLSAQNLRMLMLKITEESLKNVNCQASNIGESIRILEASNAHIRADTEALRVSASEYGNKLNQVLNRETRCMKKLVTIGKQTSNLRANCGEEKQKVLQLQLDVSEAENEAKEAEVRHFHEFNNIATIYFLMLSCGLMYKFQCFCYILFKILILFVLFITFIRT